MTNLSSSDIAQFRIIAKDASPVAIQPVCGWFLGGIAPAPARNFDMQRMMGAWP
ncbi:hypothetical protein GGQ99_004722 [Aminobacter niigataensis]|uniref:Uncharacterized protein n=1 Tax=Aminobacter niigataensis TaxID=83265 RepID=A0ABR6L808_9HYPH|nr:hypothetical protein [Aminobacter niigataensis]MBB4652938.1 hypothetical protein [Aminobacter niigataensis]